MSEDNVPKDSHRDRAVFGCRDIRKEYGGPGVNNVSGAGRKWSAKFVKPSGGPSGSVNTVFASPSVNCGDAKGGAGGVENSNTLSSGEKEKSG